MRYLMDKIEKMAEITSSLLDRKPITDNLLSKEQSKLADPEVTEKKKRRKTNIQDSLTQE